MLALGPVNDAGLASPITFATNFLNSTTPQFCDFTVPLLSAYDAGATSGAFEWVLPNNFAVADVANVAVYVSMDNNGSGVLTGGNASNNGAVSVYYAVEATA
jgi:hypothetical protein